jgi:hypothetical protein
LYTPEGYVGLIEILKSEGYRFAGFNEAINPGQKTVFLRHDIDCNPRWAVEMAALNQRCDVTGTFCFLLRSAFYNLAAADTARCVEAVANHDQRIGFHFAFIGKAPDDTSVIAAMVRREFEIARSIVPSMEPLFSWHNPSGEPGLLERCLDLEIPGMSNLYGRRFCREMPYRSDSNRRHTYAEWESIARAGHPHLHLLFHPLIWIPRGADMMEAFALTIAETVHILDGEFMESPIYRQAHPDGLTDEAMSAIAALVRRPDRKRGLT